ncbi:MAG: prepilin-type N-terminal cleavage/methylation domain-containing protein [Candidatus Eremiobacterota bacterium]
MTRRGFSLVEMLVAILLLGLVLGLLIFNGRKGMANREQDRAAKEVESALRLTRELAVNRGGATLTLVSGDGTNEGRYTVVAGGNTEKAGTLHRHIRLTSSPGMVLAFQSNGSLAADYTITVASYATNMTTVLTVRRVSGAVTSSRQ